MASMFFRVGGLHLHGFFIVVSFWFPFGLSLVYFLLLVFPFIPFTTLYYYLLKEKAMDIPSSSLIQLIHHLS